MMKLKLFLLLIFTICIDTYCNAQVQTTWVKSLFYNGGGYSSYRNDGMPVGPSDILLCPDGKFWVLNKDYLDGSQTVYLMDSLGNIINSNLVAGQSSTSKDIAFSFRLTPDSGCTFIKRHENYAFLSFQSSLNKIDKSGNYNTVYNWSDPDSITDAYQISNQEYVIILNRQIRKLNAGTPFPGSDFGSKIFANGEILRVNANALSRLNVDSTIVWSTTVPGLNSIAANENIIYALGDSLFKIDPVTGNVIWTKMVSPSGALLLTEKSDGFAFVTNNYLTILDSSANIISQNNYNNNPRFYFRGDVGNTVFKFLMDGSLLVGGYFPGFTTYSNSFKLSSMLIKFDETGRGTLDSTSFYYSGDADLDSLVNFYDDAVYIGAAMGDSSGKADINFWSYTSKYVFSADWPSSFDCGLNYKSLDANFNGIIDQNDFTIAYDNFSGYWPHHFNPSGAEVYSIARDAFLSQGDSIIIDIILGSVANPIDSIYAFSLEYNVACGPLQSDSLVIDLKNYLLGDSLSNLYWKNDFNSYRSARAVVSRRDHNNVLVAGDTVATVRGVVSPYYYPGTWDQCPMIHIISQGGYTIPVKIISNPIDINLLNSNDEINIDYSLSIFPLPANDILNIVSEGFKLGKVVLKNVEGRNIFEAFINNNSYHINTENLSSGIYILEYEISGNIIRSKVIIAH